MSLAIFSTILEHFSLNFIESTWVQRFNNTDLLTFSQVFVLKPRLSIQVPTTKATPKSLLGQSKAVPNLPLDVVRGHRQAE